MSYNEYALFGNDQIDVNYYEPVVDINLEQESNNKQSFTNRSSVIVDQGLTQAVRNKITETYMQKKPTRAYADAQKRDARQELQVFYNESQLDTIKTNIEDYYVPGAAGGDVGGAGGAYGYNCDQPKKMGFVGCPCEKTKSQEKMSCMTWGQHSNMVLHFLLLLIFIVLVMQYNMLNNMLSSIDQSMRISIATNNREGITK